MKNRMTCFGLSALAVAMSCGLAQAQLHNGVRTVFLQSSGADWGAPMNVAWDPSRSLYYTGGGGYSSNTATVNDTSGSVLSGIPVPGDLRAWNYNPNTGNLEMVTYAAQSGGGDYGFFSVGRDGSGYLDGTKSLVLSSMPGLADSQTMPAFDPVANVLYSGSVGSNSVNKVDRTNGSLISTINCSGGPGSNDTYSVGYDRDENWLMLFNNSSSSVMVFNGTSGAYIGSATTDIAAFFYGFGYANKQVWVYDSSRNGWQGYDIGARGSGCPSDFTATKSGTCPSASQVSWSGAPNNSVVRVLYTTNNGGGGNIPSGPCAGTRLCIGLGGITLHAQRFNSPGGSGNTPNFAAPCGLNIQLITETTCKTSNKVTL